MKETYFLKDVATKPTQKETWESREDLIYNR